jgi:hypothetical protein
MKDRELTPKQARRLRLPERCWLTSEEVIWAEPTPAQREDFDEAARILGDGERAA